MNNFRYLLRVRYSECDAQKVVFNGKYAEYVDIAATEFTRAIWGNYDDVLAMGVDCQVVNLTISWQAPSSFSSYTLAFEISNYETGLKIASAEVVYVMVSATEYSKMAIPEGLKLKLEKGAPNRVVNHSGVVLK